MSDPTFLRDAVWIVAVYVAILLGGWALVKLTAAALETVSP